MPRVSVLMPVYNTKPEFLRSAIESMLNQTFPDFEFLILNDSPENTEIEDIIKSYDDGRIKYIKNEHNIGIAVSRNKLLDMAQCEYVAIFDHDDISLPNRLADQVRYLDENPSVGVVSSWIEKFGHKNFVYKTPESDLMIKMALTENNYIAHTAARIRKSVLVDNGIKYEAEFFPAEDYRLWEQLMGKTEFHNLQYVLVKYRQYKETTSSVNTVAMDKMYNKIRMAISNKYPAYYMEYRQKYDYHTRFRVRLFGFIPLIKIKNNKIYLFEIIPICKIKWK